MDKHRNIKRSRSTGSKSIIFYGVVPVAISLALKLVSAILELAVIVMVMVALVTTLPPPQKKEKVVQKIAKLSISVTVTVIASDVVVKKMQHHSIFPTVWDLRGN